MKTKTLARIFLFTLVFGFGARACHGEIVTHTTTAHFVVTDPIVEDSGSVVGGRGHFRFAGIESTLFEVKNASALFSGSFASGAFSASELVDARLFTRVAVDNSRVGFSETFDLRQNLVNPGPSDGHSVVAEYEDEAFLISDDSALYKTPESEDVFLAATVFSVAVSGPEASTFAYLRDAKLTLTYDLEMLRPWTTEDLPIGYGDPFELQDLKLLDPIDLSAVPNDLAPFLTAVPEPSVAVFLTMIAGATLLHRKRRRG